MKLLKSLWLTLFPPICVTCGRKLSDNEKFICGYCRDDMPLTHNWNMPNNLLFMRLSESVPISGAVSMLHYTSEGGYHNLILNAKFKNQRKLAVELGHWMADFFQLNEEIMNVDYLIPVPLHKSRERWRGYNQAEYICRGLSQVLHIPTLNNIVIRHKKSKTQSQLKGSDCRKSNVEGIFSVTNAALLDGKSILLVDDVITTGATIISCALAIHKVAPRCRIYVGAASSTIRNS